jgi:hypothetical protein
LVKIGELAPAIDVLPTLQDICPRSVILLKLQHQSKLTTFACVLFCGQHVQSSTTCCQSYRNMLNVAGVAIITLFPEYKKASENQK